MITTSIPFDPGRGRRERSAREHARALALERGAFDDRPVPVEGPLVEGPRHSRTDDHHGPSAPRPRPPSEAVAFPRPAKDRVRQVSRRAQDDDAAQTTVAEWTREREDRRERGQAVVVDSREAIRGLWVGQRVSFPYKRGRYTGVVTKLGRSRVAVAYRIATGRDRDRVRLVHASLVTPVEDP